MVLSRLPMHPLGRLLGAFLAALLLGPWLAVAQTDQGASNPFSPEQLEQIAAPIALYPDPLVAQIMMASTYPLEVVQAARFAKANANLKGAQLDEALKKHMPRFDKDLSPEDVDVVARWTRAHARGLPVR